MSFHLGEGPHLSLVHPSLTGHTDALTVHRLWFAIIVTSPASRIGRESVMEEFNSRIVGNQRRRLAAGGIGLLVLVTAMMGTAFETGSRTVVTAAGADLVATAPSTHAVWNHEGARTAGGEALPCGASDLCDWDHEGWRPTQPSLVP